MELDLGQIMRDRYRARQTTILVITSCQLELGGHEQP